MYWLFAACIFQSPICTAYTGAKCVLTRTRTHTHTHTSMHEHVVGHKLLHAHTHTHSEQVVNTLTPEEEAAREASKVGAHQSVRARRERWAAQEADRMYAQEKENPSRRGWQGGGGSSRSQRPVSEGRPEDSSAAASPYRSFKPRNSLHPGQ